MNRYGLKGAGVWALGQEKVDVWDYEKGFHCTEYESEKSVNERVFYEYVEKLKSEAETLKLEEILKFENRLKIQVNNFNKKSSEYILKEKVKVAKMMQSEEKIIPKSKNYKKLGKISFVNITRRVNKAT